MKINIVFIIVIFSIVLSSMSCKTTKPIRPEERYNTMKNNNRSIVNIPVRLNIIELEKTINQQIDLLLLKDDQMSSFSSNGFNIKVAKSADIKLGILDNKVQYKLPLKLAIQKDLGFTNVEAEGALTLDFLTEYEIEEDWSLNTQTNIDHYEWQEKPVLKLGVIDLPMGSIGDAIVNRTKITLAKMIDKQLKENFILKDYVAEAWRQVQKPVLVSDEHQLWVKIRPHSVSMAPIVTKDNILSSTVSIETLTEVIMGEQPAFEFQDSLPPFSKKEKVDEEFNVNLFTQIPFKKAEEMAKKYVVGQEFEQKGQKVKVEDLELYGQEDKIVINATVSGSYNGSIYMIGRPEYNEKKNEIEVKDLKYELSTKNFLHKSLAWVFKKNIEKHLVNAMKFPLEENLNEIKGLLQKRLEHYEITPNIILEGDIKNLEIGHTYMNPEAIQVVISSTGKLNLILKDLEKIK